MKKGLINILIANIISMAIGIATNFLLPKRLSVETYALIKTYALYISYAGFFSLGYNDGMYLKYGGKDIAKLDQDELGKNIINYLWLEFVIGLLVFITGTILYNKIIIAFSIGMLGVNILGYLKSFYQATGEFRHYSVALNFEKIAIFLGNIGLLFLIHSSNGNTYVWIQVIVDLVVAFYLLMTLKSKTNFSLNSKIDFSEIKENVSSGAILMLGNFSSNIFTGLDRWFVKILMTTEAFANYSYAVSMENIVTVFITPITVSMYNFFCRHSNIRDYKKAKQYTLIWGFAVISLAFPVKWMLENFLTEYMAANSIVFLLFAAQVFYVVIKGIYVNIYKAEKKQNKYLMQMLAMIVIGAILNFLFYIIYHSMVAIAVATFVTAVIWLLVCEFDYRMIRFSINEYVAIIILLGIYISCGYFMGSILGFMVYAVAVLLILFIFMRQICSEMLVMIKEYTIKLLHRH